MDEKNLPEGWTIEPFTNCIEKTVGSTKLKIQQKDFRESGQYPIIDQSVEYIAGYTDDSSKIYKGSLPIIVFGDHTRIFKYVDFPFALGADGAVILSPKKSKLVPKYLFFFLKELTIESHGYSRHSKFLKRKNVTIPPKEIQAKIIEILEKAEQLKQWRQDSDKLTIDYLNSTFLKMFGDTSPKNKIGDVADFVSSGSTPLGGDTTYLPEGIVFIRSQNVHMNELRLKDVAHISEDVHKQMRRTWVKNGDVLLNITGASLGRVVVYEGENNEANVNQHVCIIRVNIKRALPQYISHYLSMLNAQKEIWTVQAGASRQALNFKQVKGLKIYLPEMEEQKTFVSFVNNINQIRKKQAESLEEINNLFESLICRVFKGEGVC
jgi:type I restriction enzyme S subunit